MDFSQRPGLIDGATKSTKPEATVATPGPTATEGAAASPAKAANPRVKAAPKVKMARAANPAITKQLNEKGWKDVESLNCSHKCVCKPCVRKMKIKRNTKDGKVECPITLHADKFRKQSCLIDTKVRSLECECIHLLFSLHVTSPYTVLATLRFFSAASRAWVRFAPVSTNWKRFIVGHRDQNTLVNILGG